MKVASHVLLLIAAAFLYAPDTANAEASSFLVRDEDEQQQHQQPRGGAAAASASSFLNRELRGGIEDQQKVMEEDEGIKLRGMGDTRTLQKCKNIGEMCK